MADHDPKAAAKEAAAVKAVELGAALCMIVIAVALQVAQRQAMGPDFTADLGRQLRTGQARLHACAEGRLARLGIWALEQAERQRKAAARD